MFYLAQGVGALDLMLIVVYLAACGYLGWLGYRRTKTTADYLLAGRRVHPFIMAMSYGATFISTSAIVGFGGVAGMFGMSLLWLTFCNIFIGVFIAFVVLGGPTRRLGHRIDAHTFPELLGRRYDSKAIQIIAGLVIFLVMPLYAAAVLIGGTEFLVTAFNIDYSVALLVFAIVTAVYVFFGGLKGVLYTDALQGSIMTLGMLFLLIAAYSAAGGVVKAHQDLTAMKGDVFAGFKAIGHQGWTAMPTFGWGWGPDGAAKPSPYNLWWIVVSTIVMGVGIGVLAQPQLVVRFLTVKSSRELKRALVYGGCFILLMTGVAFTVGAVSNVYFRNHEVVRGKLMREETLDVYAKNDPGQKPGIIKCVVMHIDTLGDGREDTHVVRTGLPGTPFEKIMPKATVTELGEGRVEVHPNATSFTRAVVFDDVQKLWMFNSDSIIPTFITSAMPRWFKTVFLLTLLSAAMSTMSSQYHSLGTAIGRDVFEQIFGAGKGGTRTIHVVRIGIIVGLAAAILIGYFTRGGYFIARATSIWFGLCASAFLPAFVGGLFIKRITRSAVIASMIVGLLVTAFWLVFVKEAEAGAIGLVRHFTPAVNGFHPNSILFQYPNWPVVDPLLVALPLSLLTILVVSLITKPPSAEHLSMCFDDRAKAKSGEQLAK